MKPKISIITITFNSEKTLGRTIQSVVEQGYDNLEYIIIDGGSKDHTLDIVNEYKEYISYFVSEPDKGISDAFNKGIAAATGDIVGIINSDDQYLPNALQTIADNYNEGIDVYLGDMIINDENNGVNYKAVPSLEYNPTCRNVIVCHPSTFITKEAYLKYGNYKTHFRYMMDQDMLTRLYLGKAHFYYIDQCLASFTLGGVTDNTNFKKAFLEYKDYLKDNGVKGISYYWILCKSLLRRILKDILVKSGVFNLFRKKKYAYESQG